ncbi:nitrilase family protein [candidate division KSB1 bacterium]|nr:nitrilase family protein [candidate division KSB1 bacterium]
MTNTTTRSRQNLKIATVQFEHHNGDKTVNLQKIETFVSKAADMGAHIICFHEACISGYGYLRKLDYSGLEKVSEPVPGGPCIQRILFWAGKYNITILAGLIEKQEDKFYNTYFCVAPKGFVAKHRKLHPFIHSKLSNGDNYTIFDLYGWKCGILICYDNNIIENVRATALLGADILFAPHVTGCTPSPMPGRGYVDPLLWQNRKKDPVSLRYEFEGPKGRGWLMRWLPARAHDNGIYVIFSNAIGMDDDQVKPGCSMIIDPYGDILAECRKLDDDMVVSVCTAEKIANSGGVRYRNARRPDLYGHILASPHQPEIKVHWLEK